MFGITIRAILDQFMEANKRHRLLKNIVPPLMHENLSKIAIEDGGMSKLLETY